MEPAAPLPPDSRSPDGDDGFRQAPRPTHRWGAEAAAEESTDLPCARAPPRALLPNDLYVLTGKIEEDKFDGMDGPSPVSYPVARR
eukprot:CAMPEP_0180505260 /NCGR_PEP_ID=MMETSP1036_2-20121128/47257_1 /TAXON_ID=632150 /ORGANISM="Azadinium spinosum, Strain 3D9" /LENGTH=85 /DNA_ID=CAMNT_0022514915 /DNA_START=1 /DNA_END=254 /DNA_ORIENTATION=-